MVEVACLGVGSSRCGGTPREGEVPALGDSLRGVGWGERKGLEKEGETEGTKPGKGEKAIDVFIGYLKQCSRSLDTTLSDNESVELVVSC